MEAVAYDARIGFDGSPLSVPSDLDQSIIRYQQLPKDRRDRFNRAGCWISMAARQFRDSYSVALASLCIAIESLIGGDHAKRTEKFRNFIEQHAPGASLEKRRNEMYAVRSGILHGSQLLQGDRDGYLGWAPPARNDDALMDELWSLTRIVARHWLKTPEGELRLPCAPTVKTMDSHSDIKVESPHHL